MNDELLKRIEEYGTAKYNRSLAIADYLHDDIIAMLAQPAADRVWWSELMGYGWRCAKFEEVKAEYEVGKDAQPQPDTVEEAIYETAKRLDDWYGKNGREPLAWPHAILRDLIKIVRVADAANAEEYWAVRSRCGGFVTFGGITLWTTPELALKRADGDPIATLRVVEKVTPCS